MVGITREDDLTNRTVLGKITDFEHISAFLENLHRLITYHQQNIYAMWMKQRKIPTFNQKKAIPRRSLNFGSKTNIKWKILMEKTLNKRREDVIHPSTTATKKVNISCLQLFIYRDALCYTLINHRMQLLLKG